MSKSKVCAIVACTNEATARTQYCRLCGASINSWKKRRPAEVFARRERLKLYDIRMAEITNSKKAK